MLLQLPVTLPFLVFPVLHPALDGWTKGPIAIVTFSFAASLYLLCLIGFGMIWLIGHHLCRRRANDIGLTDWLQRLTKGWPVFFGPTNWLGRGKAGFETGVFVATHLFNALLLCGLPVSATLLLLQKPASSAILLLILWTPVAIFARFASFPGPNPYGPIPSEAFQ